MNIQDKVVVITGAGSGVGKGFAIGFCRDGAQVVGIGRTENDLIETAAQCDGRMHFVVGDISQKKDVERLFAEAIERHGRVDILINNAAIYPRTSFLETDVEQWQDTMMINVCAMAHCCQQALPGMLERGYGRIINIGSFAWVAPIPCAAAYSASKGAVRALTRALASEVNRETHPDILINELTPGVVKTRMSPDGEDPMDISPHAKHLACLPAGGPSGATFEQSELHIEDYGIRARLKRFLGKLMGK